MRKEAPRYHDRHLIFMFSHKSNSMLSIFIQNCEWLIIALKKKLFVLPSKGKTTACDVELDSRILKTIDIMLQKSLLHLIYRLQKLCVRCKINRFAVIRVHKAVVPLLISLIHIDDA